MDKIKTDASTIAVTLEQEGTLPLDELKDLVNLDEKDVLLALGWLCHEEQVQLFQTGKAMSVMLVL